MEGLPLGSWVERVVHQGWDMDATLPSLPLHSPQRVVACTFANMSSILYRRKCIKCVQIKNIHVSYIWSKDNHSVLCRVVLLKWRDYLPNTFVQSWYRCCSNVFKVCDLLIFCRHGYWALLKSSPPEIIFLCPCGSLSLMWLWGTSGGPCMFWYATYRKRGWSVSSFEWSWIISLAFAVNSVCTIIVLYASIKHVNETLANRYTYCRVCSTGTKVQLVIVEEVIQHVLLICVPKIILAMAHVAVEGIKPPTGWEVAFITESEVPPFSKKGNKW